MKRLFSFLKSVTLFLAALFVLLSLISYTPKDITFLSAPVQEISNLIGIAGAYLAFSLFFTIGRAAYFLPFYLFLTGLSALGIIRFSGLASKRTVNITAFLFFIIFFSALIGIFPQPPAEVFELSGMVGFFLASFFTKYLGIHGSIIALLLLVAVNAILLFGFFFIDLFKAVRGIWIYFLNAIRTRWIASQENIEKPVRIKKKPPVVSKILEKINPEIKVYTPQANAVQSKESLRNTEESIKFASLRNKSGFQEKDSLKKKTDLSKEEPGKPFDPRNYKLPYASLLKVPPFLDQREVKEDIKANIKNLESTLSDFGVEAKVVSVQKGPVVTMYEVSPQSGTKIQKISVLADDIALAMKSSHVRIVAPIPGRGTVGVEIPNIKKHLVFLREVVEEKSFLAAPSKLSLAIGKDVSGNPVVADLVDMPHLLIAGATGAGKTVCVNSIISSILFKARPDEVKFIMVDPKMVELAIFAGIPHLIHPIISESKKAFVALNWAVEEMEKRYQLLAQEGCRNIEAYNKKGKNLPYIVIII
ncbi:MAG: DNA translocase FtsK 4TM domain-containing protein, partial [Candidatus Omnitrophica bacterium]|nr:DNA translocase FtsK 4TM domain-containing protein [Candidatus Omnitrophota bacterium]